MDSTIFFIGFKWLLCTFLYRKGNTDITGGLFVYTHSDIPVDDYQIMSTAVEVQKLVLLELKLESLRLLKLRCINIH